MFHAAAHDIRQRTRSHLDDHSTCPKQRPSRLAPDEVQKTTHHVLDPGLCHMSLRALVLHAQRCRQVFASSFPVAPTDARARLATAPNAGSSVETLRSGSGPCARPVVASGRHHDPPPQPCRGLPPRRHRQLLAEGPRLAASREDHGTYHCGSSSPGTLDADVHLLTDSGVENVKEGADDFLASRPIRHLLAQVEIAESNRRSRRSGSGSSPMAVSPIGTASASASMGPTTTAGDRSIRSRSESSPSDTALKLQIPSRPTSCSTAPDTFPM